MSEPIKRPDHLALSQEALAEAVLHAKRASSLAYNTGNSASGHAQAGTLWADIARSAAALAAVTAALPTANP